MKTLSSPGDLASIRNRIAVLSPTDTRLWGSMSAHQAVCHLTDAFRCPLGELPPRTALQMARPLALPRVAARY
jgi:hypothetical protein